MTSYLSSSGNIRLPFPRRQLKSILKEVGATDENTLTEAQVKKIFAYVVDGFQRGDLSTDGLAAICHLLPL